MNITQEYVKHLFNYKDGFLYSKIQRSSKANIGDKAGWVEIGKSHHRRYLRIDSKTYLNSRIIFLWHNGYLPQIVDHKDRNTLNDKIENLRAADNSKNQKNRTSSKGSSSKYLGVSLCKGKYWKAAIANGGKQIYLGLYSTEEEAAIAYNVAASKFHKEFANLNIINFFI